jgi:hypothetical protein
MIDAESAAAELERCVKEHGMVGMVTPQHIRDKNLDHPSFDVVWQKAQDLDVAVCVHGGGQAIDQVPLGVDRWNTRLEVHAFTHPVGQMAATMAFTVGGILHRFPKLACRVPRSEQRLAAVLARAHRRALGAHARAGAEHRPEAERVLPLGRCFIGMDPEEPDVPWVVKRLGEDVVVYASDYYHWDCAFPDTVKIVAERDDLSASAKKKILETNPQRLYKAVATGSLPAFREGPSHGRPLQIQDGNTEPRRDRRGVRERPPLLRELSSRPCGHAGIPARDVHGASVRAGLHDPLRPLAVLSRARRSCLRILERMRAGIQLIVLRHAGRDGLPAFERRAGARASTWWRQRVGARKPDVARPMHVVPQSQSPSGRTKLKFQSCMSIGSWCTR